MRGPSTTVPVYTAAAGRPTAKCARCGSSLSMGHHMLTRTDLVRQVSLKHYYEGAVMSCLSTSIAAHRTVVLAALIGTAAVNIASAEPLSLFEPTHHSASIFDRVLHDPKIN